MNPENYGSREACERLFKAGIVVETEAVWALNEWPATVDNRVIYKEEWRLIYNPMIGYKQQYPALSISEAWRELPNNVLPEALNGLIRCRFDKTKEEDYLISLLIWVRKEAP